MLNNNSQRIKSLDSFRGIACLIVLFHHIFKLNKTMFIEIFSPSTLSILDFVSELNYEAVMFFFVLSGFSIGLSLKNKTSLSKPDLNEYFYRRLRRILPIYILALLVALVFGVFSNSLHLDVFSFKNLLGNIFFMQTLSYVTESWFIPFGLNDPLWSISYEMFFYLIFPVVLFVNNKYFRSTNVLIKYGLFYVVCLVAITFNKRVVFIPHFLFLWGFLTWILGYITAVFYLKSKKYHLFFIILFLFGITVQIFKDSISSYSIVSGSEGIIIGSLFYFAVLAIKKVNFSALDSVFNFFFYKIGKGSYAIYALHYPILIYFSGRSIPLYIQVLLMIPFIIFCCFIENQSLKLKFSFLKLNYMRSKNK